jgi:hypothetical protein
MKRSLLFALMLLLLLSCQNEKPPHIGTWEFIADQVVDSEGNVIEQDTAVSGILIYTKDGYMSVQLLWNNVRQPIMSDSIMQNDGNSTGLGIGQNTWTPEQDNVLIDSYDAYFGKYSVDSAEGIVTHKINGNMRPEKALTEYRRKFLIKGDTLFLRSVDPKFKWQTVWVKK